MANPSRLPEPEEEGGPVKSFLEHLEDLRWTLIKSLTAIVIAVMVCLLAGKYLVSFMVWPLRNSERVFQTTAARNRSLEELFVALPTFLDEQRLTLDRLERFATDTNPLITQLRPAARELSPTLQSLSKLAPDAKALFTDLDKLTKASEKGLPATEDFLEQLHPLLPEFDPVLRQLCAELAVRAEDTDTSGQWPAQQLRLCADYGVYQWFLPKEWGGQGWSEADLAAAYFRLAAACLTTTFVLTQRVAACRRIVVSGNAGAKEATDGSRIETSTCCPSPVRSRWTTAFIVAT